jgi:class 3 adenylate cyclase
MNHDRAVPRAEIADVLWQDSLPTSWESDLSAIVSRLRGTLSKAGLDGPSTIVGALGCYELRLSDGWIWVDIEEARHSIDDANQSLRANDPRGAAGKASVAKEIARRPFLPGDEGPFCDRIRDDLSSMHRRACSLLADAWAALGDTRLAIDESEEELKLDPLQEGAYRRLMRVYAAAGDRAQALRAWERCRTILADELGVDPSPETHAAYLELLSTDAAPAERTPVTPPSATDAGIVTFLFTDLVGSTDLLALGEEAAEEIRRTHFRILRDAVATRHGEEVKSLGDGLMVAFGSIRDAIGCAIAIQQAVLRHNRRASKRIGVRIGLHVGEPIRAEEDYFGSAVVIARRLCDDAQGGEILASDLVRGLAGPHAFDFVDAGRRDLKGLQEPVAAYSVAWSAATDQRVDLPIALRPPSDPPFVGRESEMRWLHDRLAAAESGRLQVALIPGDPGVGKTRLVSEFATRAHGAGASVIYGRCDEEAVVAYQPFVEAIDGYTSNASLDLVRTHIGRGASDLARLLPALTRRLPDLPPPIAGDPESERFRLFDAVSGFFASLADDAPILFVLEDVHWADRPTLLMLRHLARSARSTPIVVVATVRDVEVTKRHPLVDVITDLQKEDLLTTLKVIGLDEEAVSSIIHALIGTADRTMVTEMMRVTEGNPLFVRELARHIAESGSASVTVPEGIKGLIGRRVDRLGEDALRTLTRAAVIGRDFDLAVLTAVSEVSEESILEILDDALEARVVEEVGGVLDRYTFTHALIRETLYEQPTASRRSRLHRQIAGAIERLRSKNLDPYLAELAYHYGQAGDAYALQTIDYATRAGDYSMDKLAYEDAARHYDQALQASRVLDDVDPVDEAARLATLANALRRSGEHARAMERYIEATELARRHELAAAFVDAVLGMNTRTA